MSSVAPYGALWAIGVPADEEDVYRAVLSHPAETRREIASRCQLNESRVRSALATLERRGLIDRTRRPGAARFTASPPDISIAALIRQRAKELEAMSSMAASLTEEFQRAGERARRFELVEVVQGRPAVAQRFVQLQQAAQREVLVLDRPPYATSPSGENPAGVSALGRGVGYRAVYDQEALEMPGGLARIEHHLAAGEEARVFSDLPLKLAVVDRQLALLPMDVSDPTREAALVRSPALLAGLVTLFDALWARAAPLSTGGRRGLASTSLSLSDDDGRVLALLATGLKDEAIARQLNVSVRTVRRCVAALTSALDAGNRFQLALKASKAGWL